MRRFFLFVLLCAALLGGAAVCIHYRPAVQWATTAGGLPIGSVHVHSELSHDGHVPVLAWAKAAGAAGLSFLVLTDHNRRGEKAEQLGTVTVLSEAELTTPYGHVLQLGGSKLLPEPDREKIDLLALLHELGATAILAHPSDWKRPWVGPISGAGGLEIANRAAAMRRRAGPIFLGILPELMAYPLRPELALAQLYDRDTAALRLWDGEPDPAVAGWCGNDAHALMPLEYDLRGWVTVLNEPLPQASADRPSAIEHALASGRFFCAAGLVSGRPALTFTARRQGVTVASAGDSIASESIDALRVEVASANTNRWETVLLRDGEPIARTQTDLLDYIHPLKGTYRVEVLAPVPGLLFGERVVPVFYSNRIRVRSEAAVQASP